MTNIELTNYPSGDAAWDRGCPIMEYCPGFHEAVRDKHGPIVDMMSCQSYGGLFPYIINAPTDD